MPKVNLHFFLFYALGISIAISLVQLSLRTLKEQQPQSQFGLHSLASQFVPLQGVFKNIPRAGYYTDKNLAMPLVLAQYQQAQYVLAPTVLEINNTSFPLTLFDCTSPQVAIDTMKALNLVPVSQSPTGLILAANPRVQP